MGCKFVVFDFDGTLADTLAIVEHSLVHVFRSYDRRELSHEEFLAMCGPSETGIIERHLTRRDKVEEAIREFFHIYEERHDALVARFPFVDGLLRDLRRANVNIGLFTGKTRHSLDISLKKLDFADVFDAVVTGDDVKESKPSPEGLFTVMKRVGAKREETVFIGDSDDDMQAGFRANVATIGAQWMPSRQSASYTCPPHRMFDNAADLRAYFEETISHFPR